MSLCVVTGLKLGFSSFISEYRDVPQSNVSLLVSRRLLLMREEPFSLSQCGARGPAN